jgi:hypothetical protein
VNSSGTRNTDVKNNREHSHIRASSVNLNKSKLNNSIILKPLEQKVGSANKQNNLLNVSGDHIGIVSDEEKDNILNHTFK